MNLNDSGSIFTYLSYGLWIVLIGFCWIIKYFIDLRVKVEAKGSALDAKSVHNLGTLSAVSVVSSALLACATPLFAASFGSSIPGKITDKFLAPLNPTHLFFAMCLAAVGGHVQLFRIVARITEIHLDTIIRKRD